MFSEGYTRPLYTLPLFRTRTAFKNGYPWSAPENRDSNPQYGEGTCPVAERLFNAEMLLNQYICPPQTAEDIQDIIDAFDKVLSSLH